MVEEISEADQGSQPPSMGKAIFVGCAVGAIVSMVAVVATMRPAPRAAILGARQAVLGTVLVVLASIGFGLG